MKYTGFIILIIFILLAVFSRKNCSKYKDGNKGYLKRLFLGMADKVITAFCPEKMIDYVGKKLRKTMVVGREELRRESVEFLTVTLSQCMMVVFAAGILMLLISLKDNGPLSNTVKRPAAGEDSIEYDIDMKAEDAESVETVKISSRRYTDKEFDELYNNALVYAKECLVNENEDLMHVTTDLSLVNSDETGTISIDWLSSEPSVVDSLGHVDTTGLSEAKTVTLTLLADDGDHEAEEHFEIKVIPEDVVYDEKTKALMEISRLEESDRYSDDFTIPEKVGNYDISIHDGTKNRLTGILLLAVLSVAAFVYMRFSRLKEKGLEKDERLKEDYYSFVNKLVLMIGAGMSVKSVFQTMLRDSENNKSDLSEYLIDEVRIAVNQIESGISEGRAYTELGKRLGLQEYIRLFSLLDQNISHGNRELLRLLQSEERESEFIKKEHARKKGEEASEKLIFPMMLLLIAIIVIVMYPAMISL